MRQMFNRKFVDLPKGRPGSHQVGVPVKLWWRCGRASPQACEGRIMKSERVAELHRGLWHPLPVPLLPHRGAWLGSGARGAAPHGATTRDDGRGTALRHRFRPYRHAHTHHAWDGSAGGGIFTTALRGQEEPGALSSAVDAGFLAAAVSAVLGAAASAIRGAGVEAGRRTR